MACTAPRGPGLDRVPGQGFRAFGGFGRLSLCNHLAPLSIFALSTKTPIENGEDAAFVPSGVTLKDKVEHLEQVVLTKALEAFHWNQSKVAEELGLSRVGLANKIKRYGLRKG